MRSLIWVSLRLVTADTLFFPRRSCSIRGRNGVLTSQTLDQGLGRKPVVPKRVRKTLPNSKTRIKRHPNRSTQTYRRFVYLPINHLPPMTGGVERLLITEDYTSPVIVSVAEGWLGEGQPGAGVGGRQKASLLRDTAPETGCSQTARKEPPRTN